LTIRSAPLAAPCVTDAADAALMGTHRLDLSSTRRDPSIMLRIRTAALLACAALAACSGGITPPPAPSDVFTLTTPAVLENEVVRIEIQSDLLSLYADGTARREYRQRMDYVSPAGRDTTLEYRSDYTFARTDGSTLTFASVCDDTALCAPPPHLWGQQTAAGLELRSHFDPDVVLRYRRVYPLD
jgi:hypothetical protein